MLHAISNKLIVAAREREGWEAGPSAGIVDRQSVKATESGGVGDFDAGKKVKSHKRHIAIVHAAYIQDHYGAQAVPKTIIKRRVWLRHDFTDGGYAWPKLNGALHVGKFTLEIVTRTDIAKGFRNPAAQMGGRTNLLLAEQMPNACKGFRMMYRIRAIQGLLRNIRMPDRSQGVETQGYSVSDS